MVEALASNSRGNAAAAEMNAETTRISTTFAIASAGELAVGEVPLTWSVGRRSCFFCCGWADAETTKASPFIPFRA